MKQGRVHWSVVVYEADDEVRCTGCDGAVVGRARDAWAPGETRDDYPVSFGTYHIGCEP